MIDYETKEICLRGRLFKGTFKGLMKLTIIYNGRYSSCSLYEDSFVLDDYSLLHIISGKDSTYMIEIETLRKYNLKGI